MRTGIVGCLLLLIAAAALLNTHFSVVLYTGGSHDFSAYWKGARAFIEGASPYDEQKRIEISERIGDQWPELGFIYPPPALVAFIPFAYLKMQWAARIWALVQLAVLLIVAGQLAVYLLPAHGEKDRLLWAGAGALLLALFYPVSAIFGSGQVSFIVAAFILASLARFHNNRPVSGAILLAVGTLFKPIAGVVGLYLLFKRNWKACLLYAAALVVVTAGSILLLGLDLHVEYIHRLPQFADMEVHTWIDYQGIKPFWHRVVSGLSWHEIYPDLPRTMTTLSRIILLVPPIILLLLRPWEEMSRHEHLTELGLLVVAVFVTYGQQGNFSINMVFYTVLGLTAAAAWLRRQADTVDRARLLYPAVTWAAAYSLLGFEYFYYHEGLRNGIAQILISSKFFGAIILWGLLLAVGWQMYKNRR